MYQYQKANMTNPVSVQANLQYLKSQLGIEERLGYHAHFRSIKDYIWGGHYDGVAVKIPNVLYEGLPLTTIRFPCFIAGSTLRNEAERNQSGVHQLERRPRLSPVTNLYGVSVILAHCKLVTSCKTLQTDNCSSLKDNLRQRSLTFSSLASFWLIM